MKNLLIALLSILVLFSCKKEEKKKGINAKLKVVATTSQVTNLLNEVAGDLIELEGLMGAGIDPHLYKASEGDVTKFFNADVIFYNGLHLEGKLDDVFNNMRKQGKKTIAIANAVEKSKLISSADFSSSYDPHFWFAIANWIKATNYVVEQLSILDAKNAEAYKHNGQEYIAKLKVLQKDLLLQANELVKEKRVLVTAHDAFAYFGDAFDFEVVSLQGLSTATEAGVQDVQKIAQVIIDKNVKAIFIESSVPVRTVEALQAAVKSKGHEVKIGGTLFSDALGNPDTKEGTYTGMYRYNMNTIVNALK
ncbi:metal ABC transporter solute-binding protein, Zn/Mn family [Pseudofulvibacter geojedonensis]|uniref:Metal ABC transporter solute-binding protein, Zn/Mn family n=1 Tax=Pseudofulvibacter geojedonensis TaxID=1123758 RepID=A0ABW3I4V4_9FLAO